MVPAIVDDLTQLAFSIHEGPGVFALLLGSGISRAADIPTGWEITTDLVRRVALGKGVLEQADWAQWYRDETGEEPNYSKLLEELGHAPAERRAILHSYIEPTQEDREQGRKIPTKAHHAIAEMVSSGHIKVIITTNFDRLLESALRECGIEPTVISSVDGLAGAEPVAHSTCYILKLHGDYRDARILNTSEELGGYPPEYEALLDRILDEYGLIIAGWSGEWDQALRAAFLRAPNRRYSTFWTARGSIGTGAGDLVAQRKARVVRITGADSFFVSLADRVKTLEETRRQNPASIDLLLASVKRLMVSPEDHIRLQDLIAAEVSKAIEILSQPELAPPSRWDGETIKHYAARYEAALEPLACACGILGRWGDDHEFSLVVDVLKSLNAHAAAITSGNTSYLGFRSYPVVLVMTFYGVALTRAGRLATLHRLLISSLKREHQEPRRLCDSMFLWAWEDGGADEIWRQIDGLDRHLAPLSEHLFHLLKEWSPSRFLPLTSDISLVYERFEILASLANFEQHDLEFAQKALSEKDNFIFMPVGRSGWNGESRKQLFAELADAETKLSILKAGFGKGSDECLNLFQKNFSEIARRMRRR